MWVSLLLSQNILMCIVTSLLKKKLIIDQLRKEVELTRLESKH